MFLNLDLVLRCSLAWETRLSLKIFFTVIFYFRPWMKNPKKKWFLFNFYSFKKFDWSNFLTPLKTDCKQQRKGPRTTFAFSPAPSIDIFITFPSLSPVLNFNNNLKRILFFLFGSRVCVHFLKCSLMFTEKLMKLWKILK